MSLFKNYKFGQDGVNVDASPAHHGQGELLQAQNAIRDPLGGFGGLKNRPGLTKFNSVALGGSALGGVGGAPIIPMSARTIYLAQQTGGGAENWYSSSDLFATSAQATAIAAWQDPTDYYANGAQVCKMGVFFNQQLFYAAAGYTVGTTSPTIRAFNGVDDREISHVIPATTKGITGMFAQKGVLYVLTLDSGTTDADYVGRCFRMTESGQLVQLGTAFAVGFVPTALAVQNGIVYVGLSRTTTTNEGAVYRINPLDETVWTLDFSCDADDYLITSLQTFQGKLYATTKNGGAATKGKIKTRSVAGVWSTVDSTVNNSGSYEGLAEFGGALYASSRNYNAAANTAVIRKSTDGASWSTVYNSATTTGVGNLFSIGLYLFSMGGTGILYSTTGAAYTAATPAGGGNCDGAIGLLVRTGAATWSAPVTTTTTTSTTTSSIATSIVPTALQSLAVQVVEVDLTLAQLQSLNTSPVTIVPAIAGKTIVPVYWTWTLDLLTTLSANSTVSLRYSGGAVDIAGTITWTNGANTYGHQASLGASFNAGANVHPQGLAVVLRATADRTGGSIGSSIRVSVAYYVMTNNA